MANNKIEKLPTPVVSVDAFGNVKGLNFKALSAENVLKLVDDQQALEEFLSQVIISHSFVPFSGLTSFLLLSRYWCALGPLAQRNVAWL